MSKYSSVAARNKDRKTYYQHHAKGKRRKGFRWTAKEVSMIMSRHLSDVQASVLLGRSVQAIQIKRCKLKLYGYRNITGTRRHTKRIMIAKSPAPIPTWLDRFKSILNTDIMEVLNVSKVCVH